MRVGNSLGFFWVNVRVLDSSMGFVIILSINSFRDSDVQKKIFPGVTHWQSPNYFAYYPSNSSIAGFLGEMLSAAFNVIGFSWVTSPAATELEMIVLDWLAKLLKLPDDFLSSGSFVDCDGAFECF